MTEQLEQLVALRGELAGDGRAVLGLLARYERPASRRTISYALHVLAALVGSTTPAAVPWQLLEREHVDVIRGRVATTYAPSTANLILGALRALLRQLWALGQIDRDKYERLRDVDGVRGSRLLRGRSINGADMLALFEACETERDVALVAVLYGGGLRRAECVALDLGDFLEASAELRVMRKGNKEALIPLPANAAEAVRRWIVVRGAAEGPLLLPLTKNRRPIVRRMTTANVAMRVAHLARRAKIEHVSPHDFRRTYLTDLLDAGADVFVVQELAGHEDPRTTKGYDRRPQESRRRAAKLLVVPIPERSPPPAAEVLEDDHEPSIERTP